MAEKDSYSPFQVHRCQQLNNLLGFTKFLTEAQDEIKKTTGCEGFVYEEKVVEDNTVERYLVDDTFLLMCKGGALGIYRELVAEDCKEEAISIIEKYEDQTKF